MHWELETEQLLWASNFGEKPAVSPSGKWLAYVHARLEGVPLHLREAVHVCLLETMQTAFVLDDPRTVRGMHWLRDDRLLVLRDERKGMRLSLHETTMGETIAEALLEGPTSSRFNFELTPGGTAFLLEEIQWPEPMYALFTSDPLQLQWSLRMKGALVHLHPDGATALANKTNTQPTEYALFLLPKEEKLWRSSGPQQVFAWSGGDEVFSMQMVSSSSRKSSTHVQVEFYGVHASGLQLRDRQQIALPTPNTQSLWHYSVSPDRRWLGMVWVGDSDSVRLSTGETILSAQRVALRSQEEPTVLSIDSLPLARGHRIVWSPEQRLVLAMDRPEYRIVEFDFDGEVVRQFVHEGQITTGTRQSEAVVGPWIVAQGRDESYTRHALWMTSRAALLPVPLRSMPKRRRAKR